MLYRSVKTNLCVLLYNFSAVVKATITAYSVRCFILTALWAVNKSRSTQLPYVGTSFVLSCTGQFTLWYSHGSAPPYNTILNLSVVLGSPIWSLSDAYRTHSFRCSDLCRTWGTAPCNPAYTNSLWEAPAKYLP